MSAQPLTILPQKSVLRAAEASLAGLLDKAISGKQAILIFWGTVKLLQEESAAFDSHAENQIPRGRGNISKPTDLKAIFGRCGIAKEKMKTAYRFFAEGEAAQAEYASAVGARVAKQITMPALVTTPAGELPEPLRAKQMELFDFLAHREEPEKKTDLRRHNPGGYRPHLEFLRPWLRETYPDHPEWEELLFGDLPKEVQQRFRKEGERYKNRLSKKQREEIERESAGRNWMASTPDALNEAKDQQAYLYGTPEQDQALEDALCDLLAAVREHRAKKLRN